MPDVASISCTNVTVCPENVVDTTTGDSKAFPAWVLTVLELAGGNTFFKCDPVSVTLRAAFAAECCHRIL